LFFKDIEIILVKIKSFIYAIEVFYVIIKNRIITGGWFFAF